MAKGKKCIISNCENILSGNGKICGTHRWRKKKFNSYDLPTHKGIESIPIIKKLPDGIVKQCEHHGDLTVDQTYIRYHRGKISSYYCKKCILSMNIKNKYKGMNNIEDYESISKKQNNVCALCNTPEVMLSNNKKTIKKLSIDHCHKTGKVRELLCASCNSGLGYFKDSVELLEKAIEYLKKHQ